MNKWFRRAVGTVGIAGGALLIGSGTAQADDSVTALQDPQALPGLAELAPDGDLLPSDNAGVSVHTPGGRTTAGTMPDGVLTSGGNAGETGLVLHAPDANGKTRDVYATGKAPSVLNSLPLNSVVPADGLGLPRESARTELLPALPLGGLPLGGLPLGGLPLGGLPLPGGSSAAPIPGAVPMTAADGVHVLPPGNEYATTENVPLVGDLLGGRGLPQGNLNTLPGTPALPLNGGVPLVGELTSGGGAAAPLGGGAAPVAGQRGGAAERPVAQGTESLEGLQSPASLLGGGPRSSVPIFDSLLAQARDGLSKGAGGLPGTGGLPGLG